MVPPKEKTRADDSGALGLSQDDHHTLQHNKMETAAAMPIATTGVSKVVLKEVAGKGIRLQVWKVVFVVEIRPLNGRGPSSEYCLKLWPWYKDKDKAQYCD